MILDIEPSELSSYILEGNSLSMMDPCEFEIIGSFATKGDLEPAHPKGMWSLSTPKVFAY